MTTNDDDGGPFRCRTTWVVDDRHVPGRLPDQRLAGSSTRIIKFRHLNDATSDDRRVSAARRRFDCGGLLRSTRGRRPTDDGQRRAVHRKARRVEAAAAPVRPTRGIQRVAAAAVLAYALGLSTRRLFPSRRHGWSAEWRPSLSQLRRSNRFIDHFTSVKCGPRYRRTFDGWPLTVERTYIASGTSVERICRRQ